MSHQSQLESIKYRNWVRGGLAYIYLKEGIEGFADDVVQQEHGRILNAVSHTPGLTCNQCCFTNLRPLHKCEKDPVTYKNRCPWGQSNCNCLYPKKHPCPNKVCDRIMEDILESHRSNRNWKNTDMQKWCSDPWEIAKCFINAPGYSDKTKAADIDITGLLHVFINNINFKSHLSDSINGSDIFKKTLQRRNKWLHSPTMEMECTDLNECIDEIISILEDEKELKAKHDAKQAVLKLKQLKQERFFITTRNEVEVCRDAINSILTEMKHLIQEAEYDINKKQKEAIDAIQDVEDDIGKKQNEPTDAIHEAKGDISKKQKEAIDAIQDAKVDIGKRQKEATNTNQDAKDDFGKKQKETTDTNQEAKDDVDKKQKETTDAMQDAKDDFGKKQRETTDAIQDAKYDFGKKQKETTDANEDAKDDFGTNQKEAIDASQEKAQKVPPEIDKQSERDEENIKVNVILHIYQSWLAHVESIQEYYEPILRDLPNGDTLYAAVLKFGLLSKEVIDICDKMCRHIEKVFQSKTYVFAAYRENTEDKIIFVVLTKKPGPTVELTSKCGNYSVFIRQYSQCSDEDSDVVDEELRNDCSFSSIELERVNFCVSKYSVDLMQQYPNVTMVSAAFYKSKNFGTSNWTLTKGIFLNINVYVKGLIPVGTLPFEKEYGGLETDVREGIFERCGLTHPEQKIDPLRIGSMIESEPYTVCDDSGKSKTAVGCGTLGCLVTCKTEPNELFGLSTAHTFYTEDELQTKRNSMFDKRNVYQATSERENERLGETKLSIYSEGNAETSGLDVSLIQMHKERRCAVARFPNAEQGEWNKDTNKNELKYSKVHVYKHTGGNVSVKKYGYKTLLTTGIFRGDIVSGRDFDGTVIHRQYRVIGKDNDFAEKGDSGSLVFEPIEVAQWDPDEQSKTHELNVIGLLVGKNLTASRSKQYYVTPMHAILQALDPEKYDLFQDETFDHACPQYASVSLPPLPTEKSIENDEIAEPAYLSEK